MSDQEYTVLIVDDHQETRRNISKLLQFESDIVVLGTAENGKDAISQTMSLDPDVVLMDINMPDMDGIEATGRIKEKTVFSQVVILSVQGDTNYMRSAMKAGATDFITKPVKGDELINVIRAAGIKAKENRERTHFIDRGTGSLRDPRGTTFQLTNLGKVLTVYSPKGGVGKTTVATNIAVALHSEETPVVVVDASLQFGDVAIFLNERSRLTISDLTPLAENLDPEVVEECMIHHKPSGIDVLSAPSHPEDAEKVTGPQLTKVLKYLTRLYSYVVVDTASGLSDVTLDTIDTSDLVMLISSQDIPAIINTRMMLSLLKALKISNKKILLVMNKYDKQIAITPEKISKSLNHPVAVVLPEERELVIPAVNRGVPFMISDGQSKEIGKGILELAGKIREKLRELEQEQMLET